MANVEDWKAVGRLLNQARMRKHLSKREAARKAGFAEITWRQLEDGERQIARGVTVPVSPRDGTLVAACRAVGADPAEAFLLVGRAFNPDEWADDVHAEAAEIKHLRSEVRELRDRIAELTAVVRDLDTPRDGQSQHAEDGPAQVVSEVVPTSRRHGR